MPSHLLWFRIRRGRPSNPMRWHLPPPSPPFPRSGPFMVQNHPLSYLQRHPIARGDFLAVLELALVAAIIRLACQPHTTHPSAQLHLYGDINPNVLHPRPSRSFGAPLRKACRFHLRVPYPRQLHPLYLRLRLPRKIVREQVVRLSRIRLAPYLLPRVPTRNRPCSV